MKIFQDLYIDLHGYDIESFIEQLTRYCGKSWKRNFDREENARYFTEKAFAFEYGGENGLPQAGLTLFEKDQGVWHVPNIVPLKSSQLSVDEYNSLLVDFKTTLVDPSVQNTPIKVELTNEQTFLEDIVGNEAADALRRFSSLANKSTGYSHPYDKRRWFEFLSTVQKSGKKLSYEVLKATLIEQGWSEEWAHDLACEFEYSQALLDFAKEA